jgi:integrase
LAAKLPRLTRNRHGTFTIRWIVPVHLRERVGVRREIKVSLRTTDPIKARILALELNLELERLRATVSQDPSDIRRLISPMVLKLGGGVEADIRTDDDLRLFQSLLNQNPELREGLMQRIRRGEDPAQATAALVQEVRQAYGGGHNVARPKTMAEAIKEFANGANTGSAAAVELGSRQTAGEKLRTLTLLLDDLVTHGRHDREAVFVHEIKRADVKGFIDRHAKRPSKAAKGATAERKRATRDMSSLTAEAIKPSGAEQQTISSRTIKKAIGHLTDFFVQALANEWIALSPIDEAFEKATAQYRVISGQEKKRNHYELFEEAEIQMIFEPIRYLSKLNASDDFWVPLLALFTGARAGELVGLRVADVMLDQTSQLWFIDVNEELNNHDGPKTSNSVRRIPIAAALVELGFLVYVEKLREAGARELFPHRPLNKTRQSDPSKHISRVFSEHLAGTGVKTAKKVLHSFRHTVITRMHVRGVPVADAELIVGHAAQDAELRQQAARSMGGTRGGTHLNTYVDAAGFADASKSLLLRCRRRLKTDPPCRLKSDPGMGPARWLPAVDNSTSLLVLS